MDFASAQSTLRFVEDRARADQISPTDVLLHLLMRGKISDGDVKAACNSDSIAELQKLKKDHEKTEEDAKSNIKPKSNGGEVQAKSSPSSSAKQQEQQIQPGQQQQQQQQTARYRHVALLFHYDGASYSGFAQNLPPSNSATSASSATSIAAANDNSIERTLFSALTKTCLITSRDSCNYSRAGRTDRGVSAWGQVVAMNVKSAVPLGARLPVSNDGSNDDGGEGGDDTEKYGREVTEVDLPGSSDPSDALDCWAPVRTKKKGKGKKNKTGKSSNGAEAAADDADQSTDAPPAKLNRRQITELSYPRILNNVLPPTIRILGWCPVTPQFSARFSCSDRTYRYHFIRRNLNLDAMDEALQKMVGKHDFRNLCKMNVEQVYNFERVIKSARIVVPTSSSPDNDGDTANFYQACHFEIIGQAFLWHQIRCIVSILFMVGKGQECPDIVDHLLNIKTNPGKPAYSMADELPLVLHRCSYGGGGPDGVDVDRVPFRRSVRDLWRVACDLEKRWEEMTLAAARLRDGLDSLKDEAVVSRVDVDAFVVDILEERRKKSRRLPPSTGAKMVLTDGKGEASNGGYDSRTSLSWGDALSEISSRLGIQPTPEGPKEILHIPLLQRSRGTTYEEKIASLNAAAAPKDDKEETKKRRRERYEENIVRKRKTTEEDQAFYGHMLSQGAAAASASS